MWDQQKFYVSCFLRLIFPRYKLRSQKLVPDAVTRADQSLLFAFLGKNKKDKIKRNVVCKPLENGGLNFINFEIMVKSLRLAWIARLISNSDDNWKAISNFYFDKYGGPPFL